MDSEKLQRSTTGAAARILLANAADGVATKAPAKSVAAQVKARAIVGFAKLDPADQDDAGLIRAID